MIPHSDQFGPHIQVVEGKIDLALGWFLDRTSKYAHGWRKLIKKDPCVYCGMYSRGKQATQEHILPKSKGGRNICENLVGACSFCNTGRSSKGLLLYLLNPPKHVKNHWKLVGSPFFVEEEDLF